jgi:hypothetical protein
MAVPLFKLGRVDDAGDEHPLASQVGAHRLGYFAKSSVTVIGHG